MVEITKNPPQKVHSGKMAIWQFLPLRGIFCEKLLIRLVTIYEFYNFTFCHFLIGTSQKPKIVNVYFPTDLNETSLY